MLSSFCNRLGDDGPKPPAHDLSMSTDLVLKLVQFRERRRTCGLEALAGQPWYPDLIDKTLAHDDNLGQRQMASMRLCALVKIVCREITKDLQFLSYSIIVSSIPTGDLRAITALAFSYGANGNRRGVGSRCSRRLVLSYRHPSNSQYFVPALFPLG